MCGIAGIVGRIDERNRDALARMGDALRHRGPDGAGTWASERDERGWGVQLAHRRLAVLDPTPAGAQPMTDPTTGQTVVFNGTIYNFPELRRRLEAQGERFASSGDTAVLLRSIGLEGAAALPSFRGMYAFATWDPEERRLLLARDPLGMKPLYLARNPNPAGDWAIAFASEVRALLASGLLQRPRLSPEAVASVVWNGFVVGPTTAVEGIELLPAGHHLTFDGAGREQARTAFWSIAPPNGAPPLDEAAFGALLEESVRLHQVSDVPLAIFLSSGVDSTSVANLARQASKEPVHTFTLAFEDRAASEGPIAEAIARAMGTTHHEVVLTEQAFVARLDAALDSLDQPTFDGLNAWFLSHAIREAGFPVALVGTGGDELFGGYKSFRDLPTLRRLLRTTDFLPREGLAAMAGLVLAATRGSALVPPQTRWAKLPEMIRRGDDLLALYQLAYALFLPDFQAQLLDPAFGSALPNGLPPGTGERIAAESRDRQPLAAVSAMEQRLFLGERLLRDNDVASMAASVEQRLPLVDHLLFEAADRLQEGQRYAPVGSKAVLRRIGLRGLPPELFQRPKRGFELPFDRWMKEGLRQAMDETLRDPEAARAAGLVPDAVRRLWEAWLAGAPGLYWSRVWAIFVLLRWCQTQGVVR